MKKFRILALSVMFIMPVALLSTGCQTFPVGWEEASASDIVSFSDILVQALMTNGEDTAEMRRCVLESGFSGAVDFWNTRNSDKNINERLASAVKKADLFAKDNYPVLYEKYGNLSKITVSLVIIAVKENSSWVQDRIDDSEVLLSLIHIITNSYGDNSLKLGDLNVSS